VKAANPKTIVVYTGACPTIKESWADVQAVIVAWLPGEKQAVAIADVIFGDYNPAGRLSVTFPMSLDQLTPFDNEIVNLRIPYENPEVGRGYRYYDYKNYTPLYAFGHGLSYTTFTYSGLSIKPAQPHVGDSVYVSFSIKNEGGRDGEEVAQLYLSQVGASFRPKKELRGFTRQSIAQGETKQITIALGPREFAYYNDTKKKYVVDPGNFTVSVGPSSATLPLSATITMAQ
jgi:beta-glucosidase